MSFLAPIAFLAAALAPAIIALYILRLRREDRVVSSTLLWERAVRDIEANAPWQRLRPNLLLLLQLLALAALVFALARPFIFAVGVSGRNLIVIIDRSASMGARDTGASRLEAAKQEAQGLIEQLPDNGRATVIAAGGPIEVLAAATTDRRELRDAIDRVTLRNGGGSDLSQALTLAAALVEREPQSEIAIISDGNMSFPKDAQVSATVRYFPIGQNGENVAISAMVLQPEGAGQTLFVQATNYGAQPAKRRLDVYLDGALFNSYALDMTAGGERAIVEQVPPTAQRAEARFAEHDALAADDQAMAVSVIADKIAVRIVGEGNRFLETALELLPGVSPFTVPPASNVFTQTAAEVPLTIFDQVMPTSLPPGNVFFIGPLRSNEFFSVTGEIQFPALFPVGGNEPLLENVSLSEVSVLKAAQLVPSPGGWAHTVVDSEGNRPMLFAGERDGRRIVVLAFALGNSDLPLQTAFPLLLSNIVAYLAPGGGVNSAQLAPGQAIAIPVDPQVQEVRVTRPDGITVSSQAGTAIRMDQSQAVYVDTEALGIYDVEILTNNRPAIHRRFAVNLYDPGESRIAPQSQLAIKQTGGQQDALTGEKVGQQELWRWIAAAALVILLIEWFVYHRGGRRGWRNARRTSQPVTRLR